MIYVTCSYHIMKMSSYICISSNHKYKWLLKFYIMKFQLVLRNLSLVKKIETAINITNKQNRTVNTIEGLLQNMSLQNCY